MFAHAVTVASDVNDMAVMHEPIDQGCCHNFIAQDVAPFLKAFVRCEDRGGMFVARVDQLKEQDRSIAIDRQVTDLID